MIKAIDTQPLQDAGIVVNQVDDQIRICIPRDASSYGCPIALALFLSILGVLVTMIFIGAQQMLFVVFGVVFLVAIVCLLVFTERVLRMQSFTITVDVDKQTVTVPNIITEKEVQFTYDEPRRIGVGFAGDYRQPPKKNAPISYIEFELKRELHSGHPVRVGICSGGLSHLQSKTLITWMHRYLFPHVEVAPLDPNLYTSG